MQNFTLAILLSAMVCTIPMSGCIETTCDIHVEIDNSLGYADDVAIHIIRLGCSDGGCPWQVVAVAHVYDGIDKICANSNNGEKFRVLFSDDNSLKEGDEISDDVGYDITSGDFKYTIDEDGIIRDSEGNVYSFF